LKPGWMRAARRWEILFSRLAAYPRLPTAAVSTIYRISIRHSALASACHRANGAMNVWKISF